MLSVKASFYVLLPIIMILGIIAVFLQTQLKNADGAKANNTRMCFWLITALLVVYCCVYSYLTFFYRKPTISPRAFLTPFWSYREAFQWAPFKIKRLGLAREIIMNMLLTVPLGLLLPLMFYRKKHPYALAIAVTVGLSILTEGLQYFTCTGVSELDDVLNNTIGCLHGTIILIFGSRLFQRIIDRRLRQKESLADVQES